MLRGQGRFERRPALSAIVTTFNEEHNIERCLDSLQWCDEVVVVDSYSTDRTPELVGRYPNVAFRQHPYYGGAAQKNWALRHARHEWVLFLDADERCPGDLRREIEELLSAGPGANAYTIRRRLYFLERRIRFCGWHNERVVRLVRRGTAAYENRRVHAQVVTDGPAPLLEGALDHFMVHDLGEYLERATRYGVWGAAQGWVDGTRSNLLQMVGRPLWRFFRTYLLQGGFLDGANGLIFCTVQAWGTFVKWSVLRSWRNGARRGHHPRLPDFDDNPETWAVVPGASAGKPGGGREANTGQ